MKKYLTEFIGTFFLVLTVVLAANNPNMAAMAPLAIAGMYLAMIYAGGHISGGHFNPAVTLAILIRGKIDRGDALYYVIVQLIASVFAAAIGVFLHDCGNGAEIVARVNEHAMCAVLAEFLGTFVLAYVVLNVMTTHSNANNSHYGIAIGFTVLAAGYGLGGLSGGAFNPAIALGASVAGMFAWEDILVYLIGNVLGAAVAATVFHVTYGRED
ncbi:MAG: aquaporin [Saprospiraceae bacterium]|nr:aquaporin [Saprospiraceae bacterium]